MLSIVVMNKRSILTAVLALGLGVTALTGCATDSDSAHSYVSLTDPDGITTDFKVTITQGAN